VYLKYPAKLSDMKPLSSLSTLLTCDSVDYFLKEGQHFDRREMDGLFTLFGFIGSQRVGIVWTDFRMGGGSFSTENSERLSAFVKKLEDQNLPLIFFINSLGARFMSGRTIFDGAFGVIPDLFRFSKKNLFIAVSLGKTLGLSALFFAQAHYRLALEDATQINLTGPEVHKKFFGNVDAPFESYSSAEHHSTVNSLVHEILNSTESLVKRCRALINFNFDNETAFNAPVEISESEQGALILADSLNEKLIELKKALANEMLEIFPQGSPIVRTYIGKMADGRRIGFFVNPPGHPNNMLTVSSIDKCIAALRIFKVLGLPVVSVLDCPGGDPRKKESDKDALVKMVQLSHDMIEYPFAKMGIINGRCFGGSGMFAFPKIFGGERNVAVRGTQMGVMHKSIIAELLSKSPGLLDSWKRISDTETTDLADLIRSGTIDAVIDNSEIRQEIQSFLGPNLILGLGNKFNIVSNG
jgi:acetyl-CoA carboxylase carboxyltransferase component